jgi:hypothetical protein
MQTTWRVTEVHATESGTQAVLQRVYWFKTNPKYADVDIEAPDYEWVGDESIDAEPGEHDADWIEMGGKLTIEITEGLDLAPSDNVTMLLDLVERVPA